MYLYCIANRSARLSTKVVKVVHPFDGSPLGHHHLLSTNVASVAIKRKHLEDERIVTWRSVLLQRWNSVKKNLHETLDPRIFSINGDFLSAVLSSLCRCSYLSVFNVCTRGCFSSKRIWCGTNVRWMYAQAQVVWGPNRIWCGINGQFVKYRLGTADPYGP